MKLLELIFDSYFKPILLWFAGVTIVFIQSNYETWTQFDLSVMLDFFRANSGVFITSLVFLLVITYGLKRYLFVRGANKRKRRPILGFTVTSNNREITDQYIKFGVFWTLQTMNGRPFVTLNPTCPRCKTKLKEKVTFWKKYKWYCINCDFSIKKDESFFDIRDDVQDIVEGDIRRMNDEN